MKISNEKHHSPKRGNRMYLAPLLLLFFGCSSKPHEDKIIQHFETNAKVVPIIEEIKIDSTAMMKDYKNYWQELDGKIKNGMRNYYNEQIEYHEKELVQIREKMKKQKKEFGRTISDSTWNYKSIVDYRNKLDSVDFDQLGIIPELIKSNAKFEYLKVKYKLSDASPVLIQTFVVENDSILYLTKKSLDQFIKDEYYENRRVKRLKEKGIIN